MTASARTTSTRTTSTRTTSAVAALSAANARELTRDRKTAASALFVPAFFLVLVVGTGLALDPTGERGVSKLMLPAGLLMILGAVTFFGTVAPAVEMRRRGTLRLLSTTPLRRSDFLLALAPARMLVALLYTGLIIGASAWFGLLPTDRIPMLLFGCLAGLAMFLSFGFMLAARMASAETANNVLSVVLVVFLLLGGALLPLSVLPAPVRTVIEWLPPWWLADTLRWGLVGADAQRPVWLNCVLLLAAAAVFTVVAVRVFRWDPR